MKYWAILLLLLTTPASERYQHKLIKIAVIDSGLNITDHRFRKHICPKGHQDFTGFGLEDTVTHGTHVVGLIEKYAGEGNYCLLIYKYFDESLSGFYTARYEILALKEAIKNGAKIINFSGGGTSFSEQEYIIIKDHPEVTFVVAAGNEGKNIDTAEGRYYPASLPFKNVVVVGSLNRDGSKAETSNWAERSIAWEIGENVLSTIPNGEMGYLSGTSMSTAIHTGRLIRKILNGN